MSSEVVERRTAEEKLEASLREKEVLLKEIHHRVKNKLQEISSILKLQASQVMDPAVISALTDSQNRVQTMALIHEKLYQSKDLTRIDLADYLGSLTRDLFRSYSPGAKRLSHQAYHAVRPTNTRRRPTMSLSRPMNGITAT